MKTFILHRKEDETGISGIGDVAEGIQFNSGEVAMKWSTDTSSIAIYKSIEDVITLHGHQGRTEVRWVK
jgi:hypothetical protein